MKFLITLVTGFFLAGSLPAQTGKDQKEIKLPFFGKIDKADLEMKECDFDKKAEAIILIDIKEVVCDVRFDLSSERRRRIKILNEKGLEQSNIHIRYRNDLHQRIISKISALTYNLDAQGNVVITQLDKKLIYDKKINKRYSEIVFTFPEVRVGSIIEYRYTDERQSLGNWYFQQDIPVKFSRLTLDFPNELEVISIPYCILPLESKKDEKSNRTMQWFTMNDVPALRDEPYISCPDDYRQRVQTRLIAINNPYRRSLVHTWPQVVRSLMEDDDFGVQLKKNIPRTSDLDEMLAKLSRPYDKMTTIYDYVRKNMQWNGYDDIWALEGVKSAWKDKKGTSGEINLILVNLLKNAELDAYPILVSTRENGRINTALADYNQFDKVLALVKIDEKPYYLDATEKYTSPKLIPLDVVFSEGLVIEKIDTYEWGWRDLWDPGLKFKSTVVIEAEIDHEGLLAGKATVASADYARIERMETLQKGKEKFIEAFFTSQNKGIQVDSLELENEKVDSLPLVQKIYFKQPISSSGDYKYFSANIFTGLEKNPFVADNRFSDIFFGAKQFYTIAGSFTIPEEFAFEELPKNTRMMMPDTGIVFVRLSEVNNNKLSFRYTLEFKKPYYVAGEYPEFKEFYKKLFGLLNEKYLYRKKVMP